MGFSMNKRVQIILLSAFVIAALCSYLVYKVMINHVAASQPKTKTVVIAATDLKLGSVLKETDLGTTQIEGTIPDGAITTPQQRRAREVDWQRPFRRACAPAQYTWMRSWALPGS
jgi:pilus assembly protein CpaB